MSVVIKQNHRIIEEWIPCGSRVLDLGCGDGALLKRLIDNKHVSGVGVEIDDEMVISCLQKGLSVYQADIEKELRRWDAGSFDYVILNATLQSLCNPHSVIQEMLRVGCCAIISVSNFGYLRNRLDVLLHGRMSHLARRGAAWNDTDNLRFVSLKEFFSSLSSNDVFIGQACYFLPGDLPSARRLPGVNLLCKEGIFLLESKDGCNC